MIESPLDYMKRILLFILTLGFFACIGIESFHHHLQKNGTDCPLCLVKAQIHSRAPLHHVPILAVSTFECSIESGNFKIPIFRRIYDLAARAPPAILA